MIKLKFLFIVTVLIALSSCAAKKRAAEFEAQPEWVKQKPTIQGYYPGVGSSTKIGLRAGYIEKSKQNALADLATEVSVQISSTSVLHTIETAYGNTDLFDQRIEMISDDYLEGFEPVEYYENEENYWVYYRIDKNKYYETKARRKKEAIGNAKAKYIAGQKAQQNANPKDAISFYLQGLSAIKQYMAEETTADNNGSTIDVGNELFASLNQVVSSISIMPGVDEVVVKRGESPGQPLMFAVYYNDNPIKGIPLTFGYSGGYLKKNDAFTDDAGHAFVEPGLIQSKNDKEQIIAFVDFEDIAQKATDDLFVRGLLTNRKTESTAIQLTITQPKLAISIENDFCENNNCNGIIQLFEKNALNAGYLLDTVDRVDYMFELNLNYSDGESSGTLTSVYLGGNIKVFNAKKELIWSKDITLAKGVGQNKKEAIKEAFEAMLKNLNLIYFRQGLAAID